MAGAKWQTDLVQSWLADFEQSYRSDPDNANSQPWADYWSWIEKFFLTAKTGRFERKIFEKMSGRPFRGWFDFIEDVIQPVADTTVKNQLRTQLHELGRRIAGEWAKSNAARRIHGRKTQGQPNLETWLVELGAAAQQDAGDGQRIMASVKQIEQQVAHALG